MIFRRLALLLGLLLVAPASRTRADFVVYSNDFTNGAGAEWSNNSTVTSNGERFLGANQAGSLAYGFGHDPTTLTLDNLAVHDTVTVAFDLYIIQSWDGNGPDGGGADAWQLTANGVNLLLTTFANNVGASQSYSATGPNGLGNSYAPRTGSSATNHLGWGTGSFGDTTYRISLTFSSSSSTLALAFQGLTTEAASNEGWGLDNIIVTTNAAAVPEPSSLALLGLGALGLLGAHRARRTSRA